MKSWNNLPAEILSLILLFLDKQEKQSTQNLLQYQLVCRGWLQSTRHAMFISITLTSPIQIKKLLKAMANNNSAATITRYLEFKNVFNILRKEDHLLDEIATTFPFVNGLTSCCFYTCKFFYSRLIQIHSDSKWDMLKFIQPPSSHYCLELYVTCVIYYRESLEELLLWDTKYVGDIISDRQSHRLLDRFGEIPNSKELSFQTDEKDYSVAFIDTMITKCKALKVINFGPLSWVTSGIRYNSSLGEAFSIVPRVDITTVKWNLKIYSDYILLYIMCKFPRLRSLYMSNQVGVEIDDNVNLEAFVSFLLFCVKLPDYYLQIFVSKSIVFDSIIEFSSLMPTKMLQNVSIVFTDAQPNDDRQVKLSYRPPLNDKQIINQHRLRDGNQWSTAKSDIGGLTIFYTKTIIDDPHWRLFKEMGRHIGKIHLEFDGRRSDTQPHGSDLFSNGFFLDHVFSHCPNITHLILSAESPIPINLSPNMSKIKTITHLNIAYPTVYEDTLYKISSNFHALKCFDIKFLRLDTETNYIHINMPHLSLDTLNCESCAFHTPFDRDIPIETLECSIKVSTEKEGDRYHTLEGKTHSKLREVRVLDQERYLWKSNISKANVIHITCKSINILKLKFISNYNENVMVFTIKP